MARNTANWESLAKRNGSCFHFMLSMGHTIWRSMLPIVLLKPVLTTSAKTSSSGSSSFHTCKTIMSFAACNKGKFAYCCNESLAGCFHACSFEATNMQYLMSVSTKSSFSVAEVHICIWSTDLLDKGPRVDGATVMCVWVIPPYLPSILWHISGLACLSSLQPSSYMHLGLLAYQVLHPRPTL